MRRDDKKINPHFKEEFKYFLEKHLFPLLGIVKKSLTDSLLKVDINEGFVVQIANTIYFSVSGWRLFSLDITGTDGLTEDNIKLANRIIQAYLPISEYKRIGSGRQNSSYPNKTKHKTEYNVYRDSVCSQAIETGISYWIVGDQSSEYIQNFFSILKQWAVKTYEGRRVTMGFILNPDAKSTCICEYGNWLSFMDSDSAAVLTDCIHSVIELDAECNFIRHISASEGDRFDHCSLNHCVPLRFTQIVQTHVVLNKVGIFLLSNGDIALAKNRSICFLRRNLRWLNLSYEAFCNSLKPFFSRYAIQDPDLFRSIFSSILDVSFSHTGGIIALVGPCWTDPEGTHFDHSETLSPYDNLLIDDAEIPSDPHADAEGLNERNKRLLKRKIVQTLVQGRDFQHIERKLRSELMALDGACILDYRGNVYSFGAIIQNDCGASGGGRSSAARKLSAYGMAVKISADGYIELYINREVVYAIK